MPELPEVETVVRTLEKQLFQDVITAVEVLYNRIIETDLNIFKSEIVGKQFNEFKRRGKYLHFIFSDNDELYVHLRMEGKFYIATSLEQLDMKHIHIVFKLKSNRFLCYQDTRKFGRFYYVKAGGHLKEIDKLGYEPFDSDLNGKIVYDLLQNYNSDLKSFLLDQTQICGIGNIYANEICYEVKKHPLTPTKRLKRKEADALLDAIRSILSRAIAAGGTTIRSYTSSLNVTGLFQLQVNVHGKNNELCPTCNGVIVKEMIHQRGTYYCPKCQRRPRGI